MTVETKLEPTSVIESPVKSAFSRKLSLIRRQSTKFKSPKTPHDLSKPPSARGEGPIEVQHDKDEDEDD